MTGIPFVARKRAQSAAKLPAAAPLFAALGDETRMRIVAKLCDRGPQSIVSLARSAKVSRQAVTKHLRVLEAAGLARYSSLGRERIWELRTARLDEIRRYLDHISAHWDVVIDRIRTTVEKNR